MAFQAVILRLPLQLFSALTVVEHVSIELFVHRREIGCRNWIHHNARASRAWRKLAKEAETAHQDRMIGPQRWHVMHWEVPVLD